MSARTSMANGAGPSSLRKSSVTLDYDNDFDPPQMDDVDYSEANHADDDEEGEAEEVEMEVSAPPKRPDKGKRRADPEVYDQQHPPDGMDDVEDDIAQGLQDVENSAGEAEEEQAPLKKKPREENAKKPRPRPAKRVLPAPERKWIAEWRSASPHSVFQVRQPLKACVAVDGTGTSPWSGGDRRESFMEDASLV